LISPNDKQTKFEEHLLPSEIAFADGRQEATTLGRKEKRPRRRALRQIRKERDRLLEFLGVQKRLVETREPPTSSLQRGEMAEA
jgi:hypothetical protein